jgi:hypothetical protein
VKAIATTQKATAARVEKGSDRSRTPQAPVAGRSDRRVTTTPAEPRQEFIQTSKGQFPPTRCASRRSHNGKCRRNQSVDEPAALPEKVRARRFPSRFAWLSGRKVRGWEDSHGLTCPVVSFVRKFPVIPAVEKPMKEQDARRLGRSGRCPKSGNFFRAVRAAREARTSKVDRSNL